MFSGDTSIDWCRETQSPRGCHPGGEKKKKGIAKLTDRLVLPETETIGGMKTRGHGSEEVK